MIPFHSIAVMISYYINISRGMSDFLLVIRLISLLLCYFIIPNHINAMQYLNVPLNCRYSEFRTSTVHLSDLSSYQTLHFKIDFIITIQSR